MKNEKTGAKVVSKAAYLGVGAAIGTAVGLLFAPKAGEELRGQIKDWGRKSGEKARNLASKVGENIPSGIKSAVGYGESETKERMSRRS